RHVAIEGVIAGERDDSVSAGEILQLMPGGAHGDADGLGLGGAGHHAAVVVGQDHHRLADQARLEELLAGRVEVVAVDQGEAGHRRWMAQRTTPQTLTSPRISRSRSLNRRMTNSPSATATTRCPSSGVIERSTTSRSPSRTPDSSMLMP